MLKRRLVQISAVLCLIVGSVLAGQVCVVGDNAAFTLASHECVVADGERVEIAPAPRARRFLYMSDAGQDFFIGLVAAEQKEVDLTQHAAAFQVNFKSPPERDWPRPGVFILSERNMGTWKWPMSADQIAEPVTIRLPAGTYDFEVLVEGHKLKKLQGLEIKPRQDRTEHIQLEPLQRLIARVVGSDGSAVPFARVFAECRDQICEGSPMGHVKCELPERIESLCIEGNAAGRRRILIDASRQDITIPNLELFRGTALVVRIAEDQQFPDKMKASLIRHSGGRTRTLNERAVDARLMLFENLEPADYALLLAGPEPLQRLTFPFTVSEADWERHVDVAITPFRLTGIVTRGGNPLPQASVEISANLWRSRFRTDEEGRFSSQAWEGCGCGVVVTAGGLSTPYGTMKQISDVENHIEIDIPTRGIAGRVLDAEEHTGVAGARVDVQIVTGEVQQSRIVTADANGNFEFSGAEAGSYVLQASSSRHLPAEPVRLDVRSSDDTRHIDLHLTAGVSTATIVLDAARRPAGGALVFVVRPAHGFEVFTTDLDGEVALPLRRRSTETIFVLTKDGSLGSFAITAKEPADQEAIPLVMPPGVATILVKAQSESGKAVAGMWLSARLNSRTIPAAVLRRFAEAQHTVPVTNGSGEILLARLPAGVYEIALTKGGRDDRRLQWSRIEVGAGTAVVEQTFTE